MSKPEQPLIVLVDANEKCVYLYGMYTKTISFDDIFILDVFLEGHEVFYIEKLTKVESQDVISVVEELRDSEQETEKRYIRCLVNDYVRIPELKMTFAGPKDCKLIEKYGYDLFVKSPMLKKYLREGKLEILTESEVHAIKKRRPDPRAKDKGLESIILNRSVDDLIENNEMFAEGEQIDEVTSAQDVLTDAETILRQHRDWGSDKK